jgi:glycerol-3-phosphate O-acyltransferase/dihydroxyacetone phosphate acyltransferase
MWLLPALTPVCSLAARIYYRLTVAGRKIPASGPVLLVANHPNSILDPVLVAAAARRPVRFLAAATTTNRPGLGRLVRAAGAIPVYRRMDDPSQVARNEEMFRAVHAALVRGAAVAVFPEGLSHDDPRMAPLKTGAARIALGAVAAGCMTCPIIPVGLVYRRRERFRSEAFAVVGQDVAWDDLANAGVQNVAAVRELTQRIDDSLREVTVNLQRWEDAPVVECAESIYVAEFGARTDPVRRVAHLREATDILGRLRKEESAQWAALVRDVSRHARILKRLGLEPSDLRVAPTRRDTLRWTARQLPAVALTLLAALGCLVFWPPYRLTDVVTSAAVSRPGARSTARLLYGLVVFTVWIASLAAVVAWAAGVVAGLVALVLLPVWSLAALRVRDHWYEWRAQVQHFFLRRARATMLEELRVRQRELAGRLKSLREAFEEARSSVGARRDGAEAPLAQPFLR